MRNIQSWKAALRQHPGWLVCLLVLGVIALGYVSNLFSRAACETDAAQRFTAEFRDCDRVYCVDWTSRIEPRKLFSEKTSVITTLPAGAQPEKGVPGLRLERGRIFLPFLIDVPWAWASDKLRGAEGKYYYLTFFGATVKVASSNAGI